MKRNPNEKEIKNRSKLRFPRICSSSFNLFPRKTHPNIILDTESDEVRTLTRQVADSLTPTTSLSESSNIEQELLDVLRGHRVASKTARRTEKKTEMSQENLEQKKQFDKTKKRTRTPAPQLIPEPPPKASVDVEKTTEAFSYVEQEMRLLGNNCLFFLGLCYVISN